MSKISIPIQFAAITRKAVSSLRTDEASTSCTVSFAMGHDLFFGINTGNKSILQPSFLKFKNVNPKTFEMK